MGLDDICNIGLVLGLGLEAPPPPSKTQERPQTKKPLCVNFAPSLTLTLSADHAPPDSIKGIIKGETVSRELQRQVSDPYSVISSFSNSVSVKRERDQYDELGAERVSPRENNLDDEDNSNTRKKLRLTKEQSALLEESFKQHSALNPKQKQELARQLNLRPRQVEVWFQNRRARTKLKQTEVDCEFLKKCCETLRDENRRLQKELQELKALKISQPFYMQLPAATLSICPSCERLGGDYGPSKSPFSVASQPHFFGPYTKPSAAC